MIIGMGSGHVLLIKIEIEEYSNTSFKHFNLVIPGSREWKRACRFLLQ